MKQAINGLWTTAGLAKKQTLYLCHNAFDDNLCVWRCIAIYKRHVRCEKNQVEKRNC